MASTFQLCSMILPQLENKSHGVDVVGMMFFDDNLYVLAKGNEFGERLSKVAKEQNILLMIKFVAKFPLTNNFQDLNLPITLVFT